MLLNLYEDWRLPTPKRFHVSCPAVNQDERQKPLRRYSIPPMTDDEEMKLVMRSVIWIVILAVTPLILFHTFNFFYPEFLLIPVAPN